jgi:hypothetical protein
MSPQRRFPEKPQEEALSRFSGAEQPNSLDTWSRCAPIRLAGYEDDPEDACIVRGID